MVNSGLPDPEIGPLTNADVARRERTRDIGGERPGPADGSDASIFYLRLNQRVRMARNEDDDGGRKRRGGARANPSRPTAAPAGGPALADLAFDPALVRRLQKGRGLVHSLIETKRTLGALVLRESVTRYGKSKLGYFWALAEPLALLGIFILVRTFAQARVPFGESIAVFMLTGLVAVRLVLNLGGSVMSAISANQTMLTYPLVQPLDTVIARVVLDCLTSFQVFILFFIGLVLLVETELSLNLPQLTGAIISVVYLGCSWGVMNAAIVSLLPSWNSLMSIIRLPLFISSGVFFMPILLPPSVVTIIEWNPIMHSAEWMRDAVYLDYLPVLDRSYPFIVGTLMLVTGLTLERLFRLRIATS